MYSNFQNKFFLYLLPFVFVSCQSKDKVSFDNHLNPDETTKVLAQGPSKKFDLAKHHKDYENLKVNIQNKCQSIKTNEELKPKIKEAHLRDYLSSTLVDSIFNYWMGTGWDFNGTSEQPRQGDIACGYFISTTLRDLGYKINRFTIGQKGAADIIKTFCDKSSLKRISTLDQLNFYMNSLEENEVLIVGLDFHVGFLYKKENKNYFAHSNYIDRRGVEIELVQNSLALGSSNSFVVGKLNFSH